MKTNEKRWRRTAGGQHGAISYQQLLGSGLTRHQVAQREHDRVLESVFRGVYRLEGAPITHEQRLMAACLATGGVASHRAAAALWSLRGCAPELIELTVLQRRAPALAGVTGHTTTHLPAVDVTTRQAIPVTAPGRTLLDLGAVAPLEAVEPALEDAIHRRLVTLPWLRKTLDRAGASGRGGTAVLRSLLDERAPGQGETESTLEDEILRVLRAGGLPEPVRQHRVVLPNGDLKRLDICYPDSWLAIEGQSLIWHGGRESLQADCERINLLAQLGWRVLLFTWDDVQVRPAEVVTTVRRMLGVDVAA